MPSNLIQSMAQKSGKSQDEVEGLWDKTAKIMRQQYDMTKPDKDDSEKRKNEYYARRVGILKNMLGID